MLAYVLIGLAVVAVIWIMIKARVFHVIGEFLLAIFD